MVQVVEYTDGNGYVSTDGSQEAKPIEVQVKWTREKSQYAIVAEAGKRNIPGLLDVEIQITRVMDDGKFGQWLFTNAPTSASAQTVVTAGASLNAAGKLTLVGNNGGNGQLQVTLAGATTVTATYLLIHGTSPGGVDQYEDIYIPAGSTAGMTFNSSKYYGTTASGVITIYNETATGAATTCGIASLATGATASPSLSPKLFDVVVKVSQGTNNVTYTFPACFVTAGGALGFKGGQNQYVDDPITCVPKVIANCYMQWQNV